MDRIIRQITEKYCSQLPKGEEYYLISDLESYSFPAFLIKRIHIELEGNLDESIVLPQTDWADTQAEAVRKSWHQFLDAVHSEVRLPAGHAQAVIEAAISDIVEILIQPRKNIPNILFAGEEVLTAPELAERTGLLVVYPHFAQVLSGYMQRKKKNELSRKQCKKIISEIDKKVTRNYTPLQWGQMLDPLFALTDMQVDADLFRQFFEDRAMNETARKFDRIDEPLTQTKFIKILSLADQKEEEKTGNQTNFFAEDEAEEQEIGNTLIDSEEEFSIEATREKESKSSRNSLSDIEVDEEDEFEGEDKQEIIDETETEKEFFDRPEQEPQEELAEPEPDFEVRPEHEEELEEETPASLNDIFSSEEPDEPEELENPTSTVSDSYSDEPDESQREESAIWQRFMGSDSDEENEDEAIFNHPQKKERTEEEKLRLALSDDERYFVKELFSGSELAYKRSLAEISRQDSWKEASTLVRQNIFERNKINIYSEAAVDFTDRLQSYFEMKS